MADQKMTNRPSNQPNSLPPAMRFQERDGEIVQAIHKYDGVLARRQLKAMFWPNASWRAMEIRLSLLHQHDYLDWPNQKQRQTRPIPEPICWLGWQGMLWMAGQNGVQIEPPKSTNESQLRLLERQLREQGIHWLREPRWSQLQHDLAIVDVRLAVEKAVKRLSNFVLETWIPEGVFRSQMDVVEYLKEGPDGRARRMKKGIRPDGYFALVDEARLTQGLPARARFLVELDQATHDNPSFGKEKVVPGLVYLRSDSYKNRFGNNSGRWLIITTGQARLKNLMAQTRQVAGDAAGVFFFTTLDQATTNNILTTPIWQQVGQKEKIPLLSTTGAA